MSNKVIFYIGVVSKHDPGAELYVEQASSLKTCFYELLTNPETIRTLTRGAELTSCHSECEIVCDEVAHREAHLVDGELVVWRVLLVVHG